MFAIATACRIAARRRAIGCSGRSGDVRARDEYRGREVQRDRARQELANRVGASNLDRDALRNIDRSQLPQRPGTPDAGANFRDRAAVPGPRPVSGARGRRRSRAIAESRRQRRPRAVAESSPPASTGRSCRIAARNVDRSQPAGRAPGIDRGQLQNRAANVDRSQLQNRNASAAAINRDNALRDAGNAAQARQQIDRGAGSLGAMQQQRGAGAGAGAARAAVGGRQ